MSKILSQFGNQNREYEQGINGSEAIVIDKHQYIAIGIPEGQKFIKLKSFVTSYSRTAEGQYEDGYFAAADSPRFIKGPVKHNIKLGVDIVSQSYNEARVNLQRAQELCRVFLTNIDRKKDQTHNPESLSIHVLFNNFIFNLGTSDFVASNFEEVKQRGEKCIFTNFSLNFSIEEGFFAGDNTVDDRDLGKLFPKKMSIEFELRPIIEEAARIGANGQRGNNNAVWKRFEPESENDAMYNRINELDPTVSIYPFGIDYSRQDD